MKQMARYGVILGTICFLASSVLAVVNSITEPQIALQKEKDENVALKEVMPEALTFKPQLKDGKLLYYTAYDNANRLNGFVVKSEGKGYSSTIEVMAGLNLNLEIVNIKILSQAETPGLGTRITEPAFLGQFKGRNSETLARVDSITGATISSTTVINSVKNKISELKDQLLKEVRNAR